MSEEAKCDQCGKIGYRRRGYMTPENWLFLECRIEGSQELFVVLACSSTCALAMWKLGPARYKLDSSHEKTEASPAFDNEP